jgi:hypothetical protein
MTIDEAKKIIESTNGEATVDMYQKYKNCIARGLLILEKYTNCIDIDIGLEHDQIFAGEFNSDITPEDVRELGLHGWFLSSETDGWSHF